MKRSHQNLRNCCLLSICFFFFLGDLQADSFKEEVDSLIARLRSLRNTDVQYERKSDWSRLSSRFQTMLKTMPMGDSKSRALFHYAVVEREIGERAQDSEKLRLSAELFEKMSTADTQHELADDALHSAYLIYRDLLHEEASVARIKNDFSDVFPRSELIFLLDTNEAGVEGKRRHSSQKNRGDSEKPLIFLDPGHGGEDEGAVGVSGIREKDLVLTLAKLVEKELIKSGCCRVALSREYDAFIPLFERTALANRLGAELFVSLHVNAHEENAAKARGFEVYYVSNESNPKAIELVSRENRQMQETQGFGVQTFLSELYWRGAIEISKPFAHKMYSTLRKKLPKESDGMEIVGRGVHSAPFFVLFGAEMPAVLLELFIATHPDDAFLLSTPQFRNQLAQAIVQGIQEELTE